MDKYAPYKVIEYGGEGEIVEKKSRFIAHVQATHTEEEAVAFIEAEKKRYWDARHHCYAYIIGEQGETVRYSDDGEPSGTAGRPMLDIITGQGIHDVLVVVTRYFGGTLLGTGGLVRAYSAAVKEGLANCTILEKCRGYLVTVRTDYNNLGKIQYAAAEMELAEEHSEYGEQVEIAYMVPEEKVAAFERQVTEKTGGKSYIDRGDETWIYLNT